MKKISKEQVLLLHQLIAEATGGEIGLRDEHLLESAIANAFSGLADREFYPTKIEKAARLGYDLISNHAFLDGNKRIGMHIMLTFMEANSLPVSATDDEIVSVGLSVASGKMDYSGLLDWLRVHVN